MAPESELGNYSDDEIEQIMGMGTPEAKLLLQEIRYTISENPLLVTALAFALGMLVGVTFGQGRRTRP